ncbi:MAG: aldehyde reductase [Mesorhizobium sp.]|nr:aldehyde reductase [Mesorhizobium sp.]MCO5163247.1 aldehyde reductase [Mesorhizobium sp.]
MDRLVLVTGGSGFIGAHCIIRLIAAGYRVRTTVRSLAREPDVRAMLRAGGCEAGDRLSFAQADLMRDEGWMEAAADCAYVLHVASPLPVAQPRDENELIAPARDGALRVLRAARDAGVKRVVLTSSFAAIGYGNRPSATVYREEDWTDITRPVNAYVKSKTLAERAAWDFVAREGNGLELATVNPVVVLGPVLGRDHSASILLIRALLAGKAPALPNLMFGLVDVRDVADLHLLAMTRPEAKGERFLAVSGDFMTVQQIALALKAGMGDAARKVPTHVLPNWVVRAGALFSPTLRAVAGPELGRHRNASGAKARELLDWSPRPPDEAIVATGESLVRLGLVKR